MKDKILELMRSPVPESYALGFELCAVHYPELLFEIDEHMKQNRDFWDKEHNNYEDYARAQWAELSCIGRAIPCDKWNIDIIKKYWYNHENEIINIYSYWVFDNQRYTVANALSKSNSEIRPTNSILAELQSRGWQ